MATPPSDAYDDSDALYAWNVNGHDRGAGGVVDSPDVATGRLTSALEGMPVGPVDGSVRRVRVDSDSPRPRYVTGRVLVRVHRDPETGVIVFEAGE